MRIGLLADTHIPDIEQAVPDRVREAFKNVDLILHAGDIYSRSVLDFLQTIAPVLAAKGDDDYIIDDRVKMKHTLSFENKTILLLHERPYRYQTSAPASTVFRKPDTPLDDTPDIIVFGHEHRTFLEQKDGVLLVNPGSPTFLSYRRGPGTIALLDIKNGEAKVELLQL